MAAVPAHSASRPPPRCSTDPSQTLEARPSGPTPSRLFRDVPANRGTENAMTDEHAREEPKAEPIEVEDLDAPVEETEDVTGGSEPLNIGSQSSGAGAGKITF